MILIESIFFWLGISAYLSAFACLLSNRFAGLYNRILIIGLISQAISIIVRWHSIGYSPPLVFGVFESGQADAFLAVLLFFLVGKRRENLKTLGLVILPLSIVLLLQGVFIRTAHIPPTISERGIWVELHAYAGYITFAPIAISFAISVFILFCKKFNLTSIEILDEHLFRFTVIGFLFFTINIALGFYYSFRIFGRWWMWDTVNIAAVITWLTYATIIHLRLFWGWKQNDAAKLTIIAFLILLFLYKGLIFLPVGSTYHVFELEWARHGVSGK